VTERSTRYSTWWGIVAIAYSLAIFAGGSLRPSSEPARIDDKLMHALVFAGQYLFFLRATGRFGWTEWRRVGVSASLSLVVGGGLEAWQAILVYRTAEVGDVIADAAGVAAASGVREAVRRWRAPSGGAGIVS
jgi:VanZ family protein